GMITQARIEETVKPAGLNFVTALRAPQIAGLVAAGMIQLSRFDEHDLAEITSPDYPGERLIVCRNPLLAEERARKRRELLDATEEALLKEGPCAATEATTARQGQDCARRRSSSQPLQDGQAFRAHHHGHRSNFRAQGRRDRRRGHARWHLCRAN